MPVPTTPWAARAAERLADLEYQKTPEAELLRIELAIGESSRLSRTKQKWDLWFKSRCHHCQASTSLASRLDVTI